MSAQRIQMPAPTADGDALVRVTLWGKWTHTADLAELWTVIPSQQSEISSDDDGLRRAGSDAVVSTESARTSGTNTVASLSASRWAPPRDD